MSALVIADMLYALASHLKLEITRIDSWIVGRLALWLCLSVGERRYTEPILTLAVRNAIRFDAEFNLCRIKVLTKPADNLVYPL